MQQIELHKGNDVSVHSCSIVSFNKTRHTLPKPQHLHRQIVMATWRTITRQKFVLTTN